MEVAGEIMLVIIMTGMGMAGITAGERTVIVVGKTIRLATGAMVTRVGMHI